MFLDYSKEVGKETIRGGNVTLKFHFSKPVAVIDKSPDSLNFDNFFFDNTPYSNENANLDLDKTMWNTLEFLGEHNDIGNAVVPFDSMENIQDAVDYVNKNGVKILGVAITGPTKEILKLREEINSLIDDTEELTHLNVNSLLSLDIEIHRSKVALILQIVYFLPKLRLIQLRVIHLQGYL